MINGDGSYDPEGHKKDPDALLKDLTGFYSSVELVSKQLDDPTHIMADVLDQLKRFKDAFSSSARWSDSSYEKDRRIELPSTLIPETRDRNVIDIDAFGGPFAPPMPWKVPRKDRNALAIEPEQRTVGASPVPSRWLSTRLVYAS
ncbi:hypothetical protein BRAS3809_1430012 [Bradyrhizobium sp. STM 3809]|nr:hypothetical protein BRAS3809_1430012 [Bradyrhizobium sp. STM 3809]